MYWNRFSVDDVGSLELFIKGCPQLSQLHFDMYDTDDSHIPFDINTLAADIVAPRMRTLHLNGLQVDSAAAIIARLLRVFPALTCADLHDCELSPAGYAQVAAALPPSLKRLTVGGEDFMPHLIEDEQVVALLARLPSTCALEELQILFSENLTNATLLSIRKHVPTLQSLTLAYRFDGCHTRELAMLIKESHALKHLKFIRYDDLEASTSRREWQSLFLKVSPIYLWMCEALAARCGSLDIVVNDGDLVLYNNV